MEVSQRILSEFVVYNKYARYIPELERRETWSEICDRYENMLIRRYPYERDMIIEAVQYVREKKLLPSMRAMQFAGVPIIRNNSRIYNCAFLPVDDYRAFSEIMFLLLGGTGVGYSVQFHHIDKLPEIRKPLRSKRFLIGDSLEGWADSIRVLMKAYFGFSKVAPKFDYSDIRPKGARLKTAGGKAPGPEPLRRCIENITKILDSKVDGQKLTTLEVHDIICHIADAVLAGGIRRSAMISLFSFDDEQMLGCKSGEWYIDNPQRGRANNSAVIMRSRIKKHEFKQFWNRIKDSGFGEPGIFFTNDIEWGTNPCGEIALRPYQFCNLADVNVSNVEDQEDLDKRVCVASYLATLQAGFTDFHYLREVWKKTTEKEALIGVGMTGIASGAVLNLDLRKSAELVTIVNEITSTKVGIRRAARCTTIKPSGTTSCVLGTSSGIHAWHSKYYIRRIRIGKSEPIYSYLAINHPELLEEDHEKPDLQAILLLPQKAPEGAILRTEPTLSLLERVKKFNEEWVRGGHINGVNHNNVSATISIQDDEWEEVGEWMWKNREYYNGISVLPADNGNYIQAPFENISEEKYNEMISKLTDIDLSKVIEVDDQTTLAAELACSGGNCEVK
jgi:ribonucleoside-diphosphate reductase alpha chain